MIVYPRRHGPSGLAIAFLSLVVLTTGLQTACFCSGPTADAADVASAAPSWLGSTAGVNDAVLPPWTPVEVAEDEVSLWAANTLLAVCRFRAR